MSYGGRLATALGMFVVVVGFALWGVFGFLLKGPPAVDFTGTAAPGQAVDLTVQTVGAIGPIDPSHPTWVSYLVKAPDGQWIHSTIWKLPAHTLVHMTIDQYDSGSPLRNQQWGQVQGTIGGTATLNGRRFSTYNSNTGNGVGHTFSIPTLGISVPLIGNSSSANICGQAPCTFASPHNVITFSFRTPGPGNYPWQCFVPCGLGYLYGNGGPMSTLGYMGGFLEVQS